MRLDLNIMVAVYVANSVDVSNFVYFPLTDTAPKFRQRLLALCQSISRTRTKTGGLEVVFCKNNAVLKGLS